MIPDKLENTRFGIAVFDEGMRIFLVKGNPIIALKKIAQFIFNKYQVRSET
jgi:hypothetical protein